MKKYLGVRRLGLVLGLVGVVITIIMTSDVAYSTIETLWGERQIIGQQTAIESLESFSTTERYSMLVLYFRDGNYYFMGIKGTHEFWVDGDVLYVDDGWPVVNDINVVGWGLYPEQKIAIPMEWDEELQMDVEVPITLEELNLRDFGVRDLPQSGHFARLDAIYPGEILKAEVSRCFYGEWFIEIRCLVTLQAYQAYQANDLEIGDYVWIYYSTDPRPGHEHETVPIVIDRIMYP